MMFKKDRAARGALLPVTILVSTCVSTPALAIDLEPFQIGAFKVTPDFNTKVTESGSTRFANGEKLTAELLTLKPKITALASGENSELSSMFEVQNGNYSAGRLDNFLDWRFENSLGLDVGQQGRMRLRTELFDSHESGNDAFRPASEGHHFFSSSVTTSYEHPVWAGKGKLLLDAGTSSKDYVDKPVNSSLRDHELTQAGGELRMRVLPGADMLLQYHTRDIRYLTTPTLSHLASRRSEVLSYVGGTWQGSVLFTGDWRVTSGFRQTIAASMDSRPANASWETRVRWQPLQASVVTFDADRSFGGGFDNRPDATSYRYNMEYQWARPLKASLGGNYTRQSWRSSAREEEGYGLRMRMDYAWSSWVDMFVSVGHEQRWSPQNSFNFSQQSMMLGIAASLDRLFGR